MAKAGKKIQNAKKLVEAEKLYSVEEAVTVMETLPKAKFDESIDLCISLGVNPKKAEENVRGTVALPNGRGKTVRVAAFCKGDKVKEAEEAGADFVGAEELVQKIQGGWMDFDAAVATPDSMALVGRIGKLLGPRGLMPNPKVGTVTVDIGKAVEAIKAGRVEFRVEKAGIVHVGLAKSSFGKEKIIENVKAVMDAIIKAKPPTSKGVYVEKISISSTMGPGIQIDTSAFKM